MNHEFDAADHAANIITISLRDGAALADATYIAQVDPAILDAEAIASLAATAMELKGTGAPSREASGALHAQIAEDYYYALTGRSFKAEADAKEAAAEARRAARRAAKASREAQ